MAGQGVREVPVAPPAISNLPFWRHPRPCPTALGLAAVSAGGWETRLVTLRKTLASSGAFSRPGV